jgi:hypothetical protein
VAEGEKVLAIERFNRKDNPSRGDGNLLEVARGGRLDYMRRGVANRAVRVGQPISMKVRLLDGGAEEEKDGAQDGEHEAFARLRCPVLAYSSHDY